MRSESCVQEGAEIDCSAQHRGYISISMSAGIILQMYVSLHTLHYNSYISIARLKKKEAHSNIHAPFKLS